MKRWFVCTLLLANMIILNQALLSSDEFLRDSLRAAVEDVDDEDIFNLGQNNAAIGFLVNNDPTDGLLSLKNNVSAN